MQVALVNNKSCFNTAVEHHRSTVMCDFYLNLKQGGQLVTLPDEHFFLYDPDVLKT
ncbi:hypothetical protein GUITHDRAFT_153069 [Guillardia theta CCMP2712]|uniref:Uncharacterized protein n=1 Tax=Guillardia theta (strain CCMP2712) TaxID=905079 RepID=L1J7S1_GUITC|nr:hypothetical protein GUITHDRAFT_153069 [Guillardia theta CCMP2712]EKX44130.1 hypothetical protein GUITHDRAFT_153069 [Guillardia theta CCMP2712]|eukprot:XP_005831110.1 hypothetical protein GUITHDRAFT_153069 [Guillardia theta CCMP2712]